MSARIPFALVGVLLLVGSATFTASLGGPTVQEPDVDRAMERTEAASQSAIRDAVTTAAVDAARDPVTVRARTVAGQVLDPASPFRDSLRLRIYLAVQNRLERITHERGDVTVSASVENPSTTAELAAAMDRVEIERAGSDDTQLRATVEDVRLTARRGGETVGERTVSPTVQVPVPTLAVHDRVDRFEQRLNSGPTEAGLGGRLTAQLYALTWTRGYAQYGGASISNVVANRHLSLLTNSNVLSMQRSHFGTSDPRGTTVLQWAAAHTAITDTIEGLDGKVADRLSRLNSHETLDQLPATILENTGATEPSTGPEDTVEIAVNETADTAFLTTIEQLNETIEQTYQARVELRQTVVDSAETVRREPQEPASDWELAAVDRHRTSSVSHRAAAEPTPEDPWHVFAYHPRRVTVTTTIERTWNTSDGQVQTVEVRAETADVDVTLLGRHDGGPAPARPIQTVHERGGPLQGPNLATVEQRARERLIGDRGIDQLAVGAIAADGRTTSETVVGDRPDGIYEYVYEDVAALRETVRNLSVQTTRGKLATYQVNPGARLTRKVRQNKDRLLDLPHAYVAVPNRARRNARAAYLNAVIFHLQRRASNHDDGRSNIEDELEDQDQRSLDQVQSDYENRGSSLTATAPAVPMRVETAPSYLTLGELDGAEVSSLPPEETTRPLVARNLNAFTVPYGDLASGLVEAFLGPERVRLQTAVQTLRAARNHNRANPADQMNVEALQRDVDQALVSLGNRAAYQLTRSHGVPVQDAGALVFGSVDEWETTLGLAEAWLNGSAVRAIQSTAEERFDLSSAQSDELWLRMKVGTQRVRTENAGQPPKPPANGTQQALESAGRQLVTERASDGLETLATRGIESVTNETLGKLPAGLPLAPPIAPWWTTINFWQVQVSGEYTRFTVSVPRGTPDTPGGRFRYVRTNDVVRLDVDGDGARERIGRTERVRFATNTSVAIAVPPGARGVGDVNGEADEQSGGWPTPGNQTDSLWGE